MRRIQSTHSNQWGMPCLAAYFQQSVKKKKRKNNWYNFNSTREKRSIFWSKIAKFIKPLPLWNGHSQSDTCFVWFFFFTANNMWLAVTSCSDSVRATWLRSHLYGEKLSRLKGLLPTQASLGEPTSLSFPYKTCRTVHMRNKGCLGLEESTWPRHYNQSMRERPWLRQRSQLSSQKDPR